MDCIRCKSELEYIGEYSFDSKNNKRGLIGVMFDIEKHLVFKIHACPVCGHSEFIYKGSKTVVD